MEDKKKKVRPLKVNILIGIISLALCVIFAIIDNGNKLGFFHRDILGASPVLGTIMIILLSIILFSFFFALFRGLILLRKKPNQAKMDKASENMDIVNVIPIFILFFLIIDVFFISPVRVSGESMLNTLNDKELLVTVHTKKAHKGDIIIITKPDGNEDDNDNDLLVKRVVAEPGDTISVSITGRVIVNGEVIEVSSYYQGTCQYISERILQEGEYYVLGDNRNVSSDSRVYGIFTSKDICGKVIFSLSRFTANIEEKITHDNYLN